MFEELVFALEVSLVDDKWTKNNTIQSILSLCWELSCEYCVHQHDGRTTWLRIHGGYMSLPNETTGNQWERPMSSNGPPMADIMIILIDCKLNSKHIVNCKYRKHKYGMNIQGKAALSLQSDLR